jgi:hypothetical protein
MVAMYQQDRADFLAWNGEKKFDWHRLGPAAGGSFKLCQISHVIKAHNSSVIKVTVHDVSIHLSNKRHLQPKEVNPICGME